MSVIIQYPSNLRNGFNVIAKLSNIESMVKRIVSSGIMKYIQSNIINNKHWKYIPAKFTTCRCL